MASILEEVTRALDSSATGEIGKAVGLDPGQVTKGMGVIGPLIMTALAKRASTPGGLTDIVKSGGRSNIVSSIFGGGSNAVAISLDRALGFNASSLLSIAAPLVIALVAKAARERNLDSTAVARLLADEAADFDRTASANTLVVREAVDTGRKAEDTKAKYSSVQWENVRMAPLVAAHLVMMADKSGPIAVAREITAAASVIDDARKQSSPTSVLNLAFETDLSADELVRYAKDRSPADAIAVVREAIDVVDRNSPADGPTFRQLVADVARRVANASKEGGTLGIGGTLGSESERNALDQINSVTGRR